MFDYIKGSLPDEYVVQFTAEDMGDGIFKITPNGSLKKGEYAFFLVNSGNSNGGSAVGAKFFDFGVNMNTKEVKRQGGKLKTENCRFTFPLLFFTKLSRREKIVQTSTAHRSGAFFFA